MTNAHVRLRSTGSINEFDSTGLYTGHLLITSSIFATAPRLIPSSGIPPAERSMKRTRLQALHSFVIYLRACLSQIVSSTPSWLVRGGYTITVYGGLVTLMGAAHFFGYAEIADWFVWPVLVLSVLLAIYTAFLFAQAKGRDFWQSPLLILHMLLHAVVGGCAALLLAGFLWEPITPMIPYLQNILIGGLVAWRGRIPADLAPMEVGDR